MTAHCTSLGPTHGTSLSTTGRSLLAARQHGTVRLPLGQGRQADRRIPSSRAPLRRCRGLPRGDHGTAGGSCPHRANRPQALVGRLLLEIGGHCVPARRRQATSRLPGQGLATTCLERGTARTSCPPMERKDRTAERQKARLNEPTNQDQLFSRCTPRGYLNSCIGIKCLTILFFANTIIT